MVARKKVQIEKHSEEIQTGPPRERDDDHPDSAKAREKSDKYPADDGSHAQNKSRPSGGHNTLKMIISVVAALAAVASFGGAWVSARSALYYSRIELRSYISVVGRVTNIDGRGPIQISLTIRNVGRTPANDLRVRSYASCHELEPVDRGDEEPVTGRCCASPDVKLIRAGVPTMLAADGVAVVEHVVPGSLRNKFLHGIPIRAFGSVTYKDAFGESHDETFCLIQGGGYPIRAEVMGQD